MAKVRQHARTEGTDQEALQPMEGQPAVQGQEKPAVQAREPGDDSIEAKHQRKPLANPFPVITDNAAGVRLLTNREPYQAWIEFRDGKPAQEVIDHIKEKGFRWDNRHKVWARNIEYSTQAQDRVVAERTAREVISMIREQKGIEASPEVGEAF